MANIFKNIERFSCDQSVSGNIYPGTSVLSLMHYGYYHLHMWYLHFITLNSFTDLMGSTIAIDTHS